MCRNAGASSGGGAKSVFDSNVTSTPQQKLESMAAQNLIDVLEPRMFSRQPTEQEIIDRLGGGDQTDGSCASLALAYAANKAGIDVLDFRDGESRKEFSEHFWADIGSDTYGINEGFAVDQYAARPKTEIKKTINGFNIGDEHILVAGRHAAVVKKVGENKFKYLELQTKDDNGWKDFTFGKGGTLDDRFGFQPKHKRFMTIDVKELGKSQKFRNLLGYINTAEDKQNKGSSGGKK